MGKKNFVLGLALVLGVVSCGKNKAPSGGEPAPVTEAPAPKTTPTTDTPPPKDESRLTCLHEYETTNPALAKQTFAFEADGKCRYAHAAYPNVPYVCTYKAKNSILADVTLVVNATTEGWKFEVPFSEDCAQIEPASFGQKFQKHL